jgi:hypothetical protein
LAKASRQSGNSFLGTLSLSGRLFTLAIAATQFAAKVTLMDAQQRAGGPWLFALRKGGAQKRRLLYQNKQGRTGILMG